MKTDFVEIFQTIRASLQPYATLGFSNRVNSETEYDLWSDKNTVIDGAQKHEVFFACVKIEGDHVGFYIGFPGILNEENSYLMKTLDDTEMVHYGDIIASAYKFYKEQAWV